MYSSVPSIRYTGLDLPLLDLLKKRGMVHSMPPGKDRKR